MLVIWAIISTVTGQLIGSAYHLAVVHRAGFSNHAHKTEVGMMGSFVKLVSIGDTSYPTELAVGHISFGRVFPISDVGDRLGGEYRHAIEWIALGNLVAIGKRTATLVLNTELFFKRISSSPNICIWKKPCRQSRGDAIILHDQLDIGTDHRNAVEVPHSWWRQRFGRICANPGPVASSQGFVGSIVGSLSSINSIFHFSELLIVNPPDSETYGDGPKFQGYLPQWRRIGLGVVGLGLMFWGWFNLRRGVHVYWGLLFFEGGVALWSFIINWWLNWSLGF
jgi:hypothetical protein